MVLLDDDDDDDDGNMMLGWGMWMYMLRTLCLQCVSVIISVISCEVFHF